MDPVWEPLRALFAADLSSAVLTCAGCGSSTAMDAHDVYPDAPALVVRCPSCEAVVLRFGAAGGRIRLDMSGTRLMVLADTG
jgi:hypothetical protein